jgi:hypothetical protein
VYIARIRQSSRLSRIKLAKHLGARAMAIKRTYYSGGTAHKDNCKLNFIVLSTPSNKLDTLNYENTSSQRWCNCRSMKRMPIFLLVYPDTTILPADEQINEIHTIKVRDPHVCTLRQFTSTNFMSGIAIVIRPPPPPSCV